MAGTSNRRTGNGRKSPEAMAVIRRGPGMARPQPPEVFGEPERAAWTRIVDACPADWFTSENCHLLERLCVLIAWSQNMEAELRRNGQYRFADKKDNAAYLDTLKQIAHLSTKLRLTPQSRYNRFEASSRMKHRAVARPWEDVLDYGPTLRVVNEED